VSRDRWLVTTLASLGAAISMASIAAAPFELPAPTGRYAVGTMTWRVTDDARRETFSESVEPRQVEVLAWYPLQESGGGGRAPYLREGLAEVRTFATLFGVPESSFDDLADVRTHGELDGGGNSRDRSRGADASPAWVSGRSAPHR
jgi:hypothetical protein